jgi:transposase-like protein
MTQKTLDAITALYRSRMQFRETYQVATAGINAAIRELEDSCDHLNPDGTSAIVTGFTSDLCQLCCKDNG